MIESWLLEQLVAVRDHETLIAAADSLHITQPALSKSMKKLEDQMDMPLFVRTNRKIELNKTGKFFADRAAEYLSQGETLLEQVYAYDRSQRNISVGTCAPIPLWELTPVLSTIFPKLSITTQTDETDRLLKGLSQNKYQIIVTNSEPAGSELYVMKFRTETMSVSVPPSHPFYDRDSLSPTDLNGQFFVVYHDIGVWGDWIKEHFSGIRLMTVSDQNALRDAIGLGTALSFVSDYVANLGYSNTEQKIIPLDMEEKSISYFLVCKKSEFTKFRRVFQQLAQ